MPYALQGRIEPGLVFDRITNIDGVPDGYRGMYDREDIKVMITYRPFGGPVQKYRFSTVPMACTFRLGSPPVSYW